MSSFRKIIRIGKYTTFAVAFSVALSGCSILPQKKATVDPNASKLVVWSFEDEDVWKPVKKSFESANKGYTLVYQKQTFDANYENRVLNSMLATRKPDVWAMPNDWVYRHKEKLYPMPDTLAKTVKMDDQFVPAVKQSVYFNNKTYALTPSVEPLMVYYNPAILTSTLADLRIELKDDKEEKTRVENLLKDVPSTWTEFTEAAKLLTKTDGNTITTSGLALGTSKISLAPDITYLLMLQNETDILSKEYTLSMFNLPKATTVGADDNPGKRAMEFYTSFADPGSENYTWNDELGNDVDAFASGKVAMILGYSDLQNYFAQKYPEFKYKKAFAPQVSQDESKIVDFAKFQAFGVSTLSMNPGLGWNIVYTLSTSQSSTFSSATRQYTSAKSKDYNISITQRKGNNPEKLSLATAKSLVKGRYPIDFDAAIREAINNVNTGTQDANTALDLAASKTTESLRKTDW